MKRKNLLTKLVNSDYGFNLFMLSFAAFIAIVLVISGSSGNSSAVNDKVYTKVLEQSEYKLDKNYCTMAKRFAMKKKRFQLEEYAESDGETVKCCTRYERIGAYSDIDLANLILDKVEELSRFYATKDLKYGYYFVDDESGVYLGVVVESKY